MKLTDRQYEDFFDQIMYAMYRQTKGGLKKHVPIEAIKKLIPHKYRVSKLYNSNFKKVLNDIVKMGYITQHKTGGGMTYEFSTLGRDYALTSFE